MKEGYYIANGKKTILESNEHINLYNMGITELVIPDGVKYVYCNNNQLSELILPEGITHVWCDKNLLNLKDYIGNMKIIINIT